MRIILRWTAIILAMGALAVWLAGGAHRGWTRTSVEVKTLDEVTGIEGITHEKRFVAGLDFLGAAALGAGVLAAASYLFRRNPET